MHSHEFFSLVTILTQLQREARVASTLISKLSYGFNHGIGRRGDISAPQPKAPGTSILYQITNRLALQALKKFGIPNLKSAIVVPLSTGMSIGLSFAAIRKKVEHKIVLCPRIDHTSPIKGLELAGFTPQKNENFVDFDGRIRYFRKIILLCCLNK